MKHHSIMESAKQLVLAMAILTGSSATALQPAQEAVKELKVAEGMEVTLFAAEPMLRNPTSIDVDAQGRVWVLEAVNYRLFNQKIEDEKGDRIRVLEDTNGDGVADKATTFYQDPSLQAPMGIAVLGNRVYVCQSPEIFYLEDLDGDGKADKKTVILTGFKGIDHDHSIHGIQFGPDGYLYMSNGDEGFDVTDGSGHRVQAGGGALEYIAATVLRTDLEGQHLEVLASNMRNPYEPTVDSFGNVYISDNDDDGNEQTRLNYVFEGGIYGYHMVGTGARRKGNSRLDAVHWNEDQPGIVPKMINTGFGSPTGLMAYEGTHLPERLFGQLIHCDPGPGEVRAFKSAPNGVGKSATMEVLLTGPNDSWFRPVDACAAPDGSVFIADWYDAGVGGHRMVDATQGRIYRLTKKGAGKSYALPAVDLRSAKGLAEAFSSPNLARRFLANEAFKTIEAQVKNTLIEEYVKTGANDIISLRAFWLMMQDSTQQAFFAKEFFQSTSVDQQIMAVRALSRFAEDNKELVEEYVLNNPNPGVRRQLLLEMGFPYRGEQGKLASRTDDTLYGTWFSALQAQYDGQDRFYREALGIAARGHESEAYGIAKKQFGSDWNAQLAGLAFQYHPVEAFDLAREAAENTQLDFALRELALRTVAAIGNDTAGQFLVRAAFNPVDPELQVLAFNLLGLHGGDVWRDAMDKNGFDEKISEKLALGEDAQGTLAFIRSSNRSGAIEPILKALLPQTFSVSVQVDYLNTLASILRNGRFDQYKGWINRLAPLLNSEHETIQTATVSAIARMRGEAIRKTLLPFAQDTSKSHAARVLAVRALARDKGSAKALLAWTTTGEVPENLKFSAMDALRNSSVSEVRAIAVVQFPAESTRDGQALPSMRRLRYMNGDATQGRVVFFDETKSSCSRCHDIATSGKIIGPHLGKIGEKLAKQALLESILDPSAAISHEYAAWYIETKDGEGVLGYIRSEDASSLELIDSAGTVMRIPVDTITMREASPVSIMPAGLIAGMTAQELVDLLAFLETLK